MESEDQYIEDQMNDEDFYNQNEEQEEEMNPYNEVYVWGDDSCG